MGYPHSSVNAPALVLRIFVIASDFIAIPEVTATNAEKYMMDD
jgi:hypothetical protein